MDEVIYIQYAFFDRTRHHGIVFHKDADIQKHLDDHYAHKSHHYSPDHNSYLSIDTNKMQNYGNAPCDRINVLCECDIYGECKETIIYDEELEETIEALKRFYRLLPSGLEEGKYCQIETFEQTEELLDGSTLYTIGVDKAFEIDGKEVYFDQTFRLIMNAPIIR